MSRMSAKVAVEAMQAAHEEYRHDPEVLECELRDILLRVVPASVEKAYWDNIGEQGYGW